MVEVTTSPTSSASDGHSCDDVRVEGALQQREGFYEQWMESLQVGFSTTYNTLMQFPVEIMRE